MENFNLVYAKALYLRFCAIYGDKFFKSYHNDDFKTIWYNEWSTGLAGVDPSVVKGVLETCKLTLDWPPSIAEFRHLCEQASGVPSSEMAFQAAIRREFSHPVIHLAYEKVGSWAMKNDKDAALKPKFQAAYKDSLNQFRINPDRAWELLEEFKALPSPTPIASNIPTSEELISFKERLKQWTELSAIEKKKLTPDSHPVWDKFAVMVGHPNFDHKVYLSRRDYLTNLDELVSSTLNTADQYDRIRFLREELGARYVDSLKDGTYVPPKEKTSPRSFKGGKTIFKGWMDD